MIEKEESRTPHIHNGETSIACIDYIKKKRKM